MSIFPLLFVGSVVYLYWARSPTAVESNKFLYFISVEVGSALFINNSWAVLPVMLIGMAPLWVWVIPFMGFTVLGWINAVRFYYYYFVSAQYPHIAEQVTKAVANMNGLVKWIFPVCVEKGGCSWTRDLQANTMIGLWWDDAFWLLLVILIFVAIEGLRHRTSPFKIVMWWISMIVFGWDTITPIFLLWLKHTEYEHALNRIKKRDIGQWHLAYMAMAIISVCAWWPPLLEWAITRGTVSGQLEAGMETVSGARATILIMGTFWPWVIFFTNDITVGIEAYGRTVGYTLSLILRMGVLFLFMGHVAGALSIVLLFREFTPDQTLIHSPHSQHDEEAAAAAAADNDKRKKKAN